MNHDTSQFNNLAGGFYCSSLYFCTFLILKLFFVILSIEYKDSLCARCLFFIFVHPTTMAFHYLARSTRFFVSRCPPKNIFFFIFAPVSIFYACSSVNNVCRVFCLSEMNLHFLPICAFVY